MMIQSLELPKQVETRAVETVSGLPLSIVQKVEQRGSLLSQSEQT